VDVTGSRRARCGAQGEDEVGQPGVNDRATVKWSMIAGCAVSTDFIAAFDGVAAGEITMRIE